MTTQVDEWLAQNSIDCERLGARISKAQCQANQGHTFACEDCPESGVKYSGKPKAVRKSRCKRLPISETTPATLPNQISVITVPPVEKIVLVFTADNAEIMKRFEQLSQSTGGNTTDDICSILDLIMSKKLRFREAV